MQNYIVNNGYCLIVDDNNMISLIETGYPYPSDATDFYKVIGLTADIIDEGNKYLMSKAKEILGNGNKVPFDDFKHEISKIRLKPQKQVEQINNDGVDDTNYDYVFDPFVESHSNSKGLLGELIAVIGDKDELKARIKDTIDLKDYAKAASFRSTFIVNLYEKTVTPVNIDKLEFIDCFVENIYGELNMRYFLVFILRLIYGLSYNDISLTLNMNSSNRITQSYKTKLNHLACLNRTKDYFNFDKFIAVSASSSDIPSTFISKDIPLDIETLISCVDIDAFNKSSKKREDFLYSIYHTRELCNLNDISFIRELLNLCRNCPDIDKLRVGVLSTYYRLCEGRTWLFIENKLNRSDQNCIESYKKVTRRLRGKYRKEIEERKLFSSFIVRFCDEASNPISVESSIAVLGLSTKLYNNLVRQEIIKIKDLMDYRFKDLQLIHGVSAESAKEIKRALYLNDYSLASDASKMHPNVQLRHYTQLVK